MNKILAVYFFKKLQVLWIFSFLFNPLKSVETKTDRAGYIKQQEQNLLKICG